MSPAGYMAKKVLRQPGWLKSAAVADVCSVSGCLSEYFCDYIRHWKHNGFWLFDSPASLASLADATSTTLRDHDIFYYEVYERQFDEDEMAWEYFEPEMSFKTLIERPRSKELLGFDVVTFSTQQAPECSPLSCNSLAETIPVNEHCLLDTLDDAIRLVETGAFNNSEPGPFRIFAVYKLPTE